MKPQIKQPGKKLSEAKLAKLETKFKIRLPKAYRNFMLKNNGGVPAPSGVCRKGRKSPGEACDCFYTIDSVDDYDDWVTEFKRMKDPKKPRLPHRLVPIADDPGGNLFCISVSGQDTGKIYFWHHEEEYRLHEPEGAEPDDSGIHLIADSFNDFLNQFALSPEEKEEERLRKRPAKEWETLISDGDVAGVAKWLAAGGSLEERNWRGITPVELAAEEENSPLVELLIDRGASWEKALAFSFYCQRWSVVPSILSRAPRGKAQIRPVSFANALQTCNDVKVIEAMLNAGAPVHGEYMKGSPLYWATMDHANPQIVKLLLKHGAKLHQTELKMSPLAQAICLGNLETVKLLLDAGEHLYASPAKSREELDREEDLRKAEASGRDEMWIQICRTQLARVRSNNPKAAAYYFDRSREKLRSARLVEKFKQDVVNYAARLGQKPPPAARSAG